MHLFYDVLAYFLVTCERNLPCQEGSLNLVCRKTWRSIQDKFYKSKTSSRFPNFDTSNAWQVRVFFLGKNCSWTLLPGSIWLRTPITRLRYISCLRSFRTYFDSLKRADDSRVYRDYDASQPTGRHTRYFKTMLKILVDRALMRHISFLFDEFRLTLDRFTCCAHVTITDVNNLFPDFRSIYAVRLDFDFIHYKQSACLLFNK